MINQLSTPSIYDSGPQRVTRPRGTSITANGKKESCKAGEHLNGRQVVVLMESGKIIRSRETVCALVDLVALVFFGTLEI